MKRQTIKILRPIRLFRLEGQRCTLLWKHHPRGRAGIPILAACDELASSQPFYDQRHQSCPTF